MSKKLKPTKESLDRIIKTDTKGNKKRETYVDYLNRLPENIKQGTRVTSTDGYVRKEMMQVVDKLEKLIIIAIGETTYKALDLTKGKTVDILPLRYRELKNIINSSEFKQRTATIFKKISKTDDSVNDVLEDNNHLAIYDILLNEGQTTIKKETEKVKGKGKKKKEIINEYVKAYNEFVENDINKGLKKLPIEKDLTAEQIAERQISIKTAKTRANVEVKLFNTGEQLEQTTEKVEELKVKGTIIKKKATAKISQLEEEAKAKEIEAQRRIEEADQAVKKAENQANQRITEAERAIEQARQRMGDAEMTTKQLENLKEEADKRTTQAVKYAELAEAKLEGATKRLEILNKDLEKQENIRKLQKKETTKQIEKVQQTAKEKIAEKEQIYIQQVEEIREMNNEREQLLKKLQETTDLKNDILNSATINILNQTDIADRALQQKDISDEERAKIQKNLDDLKNDMNKKIKDKDDEIKRIKQEQDEATEKINKQINTLNAVHAEMQQTATSEGGGILEEHDLTADLKDISEQNDKMADDLKKIEKENEMIKKALEERRKEFEEKQKSTALTEFELSEAKALIKTRTEEAQKAKEDAQKAEIEQQNLIKQNAELQARINELSDQLPDEHPGLTVVEEGEEVVTKASIADKEKQIKGLLNAIKKRTEEREKAIAYILELQKDRENILKKSKLSLEDKETQLKALETRLKTIQEEYTRKNLLSENQKNALEKEIKILERETVEKPTTRTIGTQVEKEDIEEPIIIQPFEPVIPDEGWELHYRSPEGIRYNYLGPFTNTIHRVYNKTPRQSLIKFGQMDDNIQRPVDFADALAFVHDIRFTSRNKKYREEANVEMIDGLDVLLRIKSGDPELDKKRKKTIRTIKLALGKSTVLTLGQTDPPYPSDEEREQIDNAVNAGVEWINSMGYTYSQTQWEPIYEEMNYTEDEIQGYRDAFINRLRPLGFFKDAEMTKEEQKEAEELFEEIEEPREEEIEEEKEEEIEEITQLEEESEGYNELVAILQNNEPGDSDIDISVEELERYGENIGFDEGDLEIIEEEKGQEIVDEFRISGYGGGYGGGGDGGGGGDVVMAPVIEQIQDDRQFATPRIPIRTEYNSKPVLPRILSKIVDDVNNTVTRDAQEDIILDTFLLAQDEHYQNRANTLHNLIDNADDLLVFDAKDTIANDMYNDDIYYEQYMNNPDFKTVDKLIDDELDKMNIHELYKIDENKVVKTGKYSPEVPNNDIKDRSFDIKDGGSEKLFVENNLQQGFMRKDKPANIRLSSQFNNVYDPLRRNISKTTKRGKK